jgi:hypothetical protein
LSFPALAQAFRGQMGTDGKSPRFQATTIVCHTDEYQKTSRLFPDFPKSAGTCTQSGIVGQIAEDRETAKTDEPAK